MAALGQRHGHPIPLGHLGSILPGTSTGGGSVTPLTAIRATSAGFGSISELSPSSGIAQTTRAVAPPFLEAFSQFRLVYALFRIRTTSFTATVDNEAGGAGNVLTVTAISTGSVNAGQPIANAGLAAGVVVNIQLSGTPGGIGRYAISGAAVQIASSTFTANFAEEFFQGAGAQFTLDAGVLDTVYNGYTGIPARQRAPWDSGNPSKAYNYATQDKSVPRIKSDWMTRPSGVSAAPMEIWTRVVLPSNGFGLPVNKLAQNYFRDRGWGNDLVGSGTSVDPVTGTSITSVATTSGGVTACITPIAIEIMVAGVAKTVLGIGDSRFSATGLGVNEPAGYGDTQGDYYGLNNAMERGIYGVARQHSVILGKPSDRATWLSQAPNTWKLRLALLNDLGDNTIGAKIVINGYGQNDQNTSTNPITAYSSGMNAPLGMPITTSSRVYIVTNAGTGGTTAPTSTAQNVDIAFGTATIRYLGTSTDALQRQGLAIAGKNALINATIRATIPNVSIVQEGLGPFTGSSDSWATAANQSDTATFNATGAYYQQQLTAQGALTLTGADRVVSMMPLLAGSRTVNGGADDGTRSWGTDPAGNVPYRLTPDGIHNGNYGAEVGKPAWTKLALTGVA